jgi:hypothetical protein
MGDSPVIFLFMPPIFCIDPEAKILLALLKLKALNFISLRIMVRPPNNVYNYIDE